MKKKIAVGLSGGIDSSFAAYRLKKEGWDVIGFTLKFYPQDNRCCDLDGLYRAQRLCSALGIPHYTLDATEVFSASVVSDFLSSYLSGSTPNPCARCNKHIKFGFLFEKLVSLGIEYLATGHYARLLRYRGDLYLAQAKDTKKTQEYFLSLISPKMLAHLVFPLADYTKEEVKKIVRERKLVCEERKESQDICFIAGSSYAKFIETHTVAAGSFQGPIVHVNGTVLGAHKGIYYFTYGQREGLGIGWKEPLYVVALDEKTRTVFVGERHCLAKSVFTVSGLNWFGRAEEYLSANKSWQEHVEVKIRYNAPRHPCILDIGKDRVKVTLKAVTNAVTPGQVAAFYYKNMLVGAGLIQKEP